MTTDRPDRPLLLRIDINDLCNQLCTGCFYPKYASKGHRGHSMSLHDFEKIAAETFHLAYYVQLPFGFEPLMHPRFDRIVRIAARYNVPNTGVVTNGSLLLGKRAEAILETQAVTGLAISIDSTDPIRFRQLRGRDHVRLVMRNAETFIRARTDSRVRYPCVVANTIIMRSNMKELPKTLESIISLGVDEVQMFHIEPMDTSNPESAVHCPAEWNEAHERLGEVIRRNSKTRVYLPPPYEADDISKDGRSLQRHTQLSRRSSHETYETDAVPPGEPDSYPEGVFCVCPWMVAIINCWGDLMPCSHRNEPLGNVLNDGFEKAFNSNRHLRLRNNLVRGKLKGACALCTSKTPSSDPLRRRIVRAIDWQPAEA